MTCPVVESIFNVWSLTDFFIEVLFTVKSSQKACLSGQATFFHLIFFSAQATIIFHHQQEEKVMSSTCLPVATQVCFLKVESDPVTTEVGSSGFPAPPTHPHCLIYLA